MKKVSAKEIIGWVLLGLIIFVPTILLAIRAGYVPNILSIIGLVFLILMFIGAAGRLIK